MATPAPFPFDVPIIQLDARGNPAPGWPMSKDMAIYFETSLIQPVSNTPQFYPIVNLAAQSATIATTPIPLPTLASGLYRLTYYARITTVDAVSSSLTITLSWTDGAIACSLSGTAITGNTTATVQTASAMVDSDAASPLSYAALYASNTPAAMKFKLKILVEAV